MAVDTLFSKNIGSLFVDVKKSKDGTKTYIQLTSSKKDEAGQWIKTRIPVFSDQVAPLIDALQEAQGWL